MPPQLQYPDIDPPKDWTYFRAGPQIRLIPPGTRQDTAEHAIIISPIVPKLPQMPGLSALIEQALEAESRMSFEVTAKSGPTPVTSTTGLTGVSYDVSGYARPNRPSERRLYVMLEDDKYLYGVSYLTAPELFDQHVDTFWAVAKSVRPFDGRAVPPAPYPFPVE